MTHIFDTICFIWRMSASSCDVDLIK